MEKEGFVNVDVGGLAARMTRFKGGAGNSEASQPRKAVRVVHNISVDTTKKDEGSRGSSGSESLQTQTLNSLKPVATSGDDYVFGTTLDNSSSVAMAGTNSSSDEYPSLAAATGGVSNVASVGESLHQSIDANAPDGDGIRVAPMAGRFKTVSSTSAQDKGPDFPSMPSVGLSQDSPMVQSVEVTKQPTSYVGAATGTQSAPTKVGNKKGKNKKDAKEQKAGFSGLPVGKNMQYRPVATKQPTSNPSHGEASTSYGHVPKSVGAVKATSNSNSSEIGQPSQPTPTVTPPNSTSSNSQPTTKVPSPKMAANVRQVVNENNLCICAVLESHVDAFVVYDTCRKVCSRWKWTSNGSICDKGSRIILGWNDDIVDVMIMSQTNQIMHVQVNIRAENKTLFCSFVYADNYYVKRRALWSNLESHAKCVTNMEVADVNSTGLHFTWNQKPKGSNRTLKKIDRIMSNLQFCDTYPGSFAIFLPYRISDHSPCVLRIPHVAMLKPKPFKFSNFLVHKEGFMDTANLGWNMNVNGCAMYRVLKRLKGLKSPFRKLLHNQGNLHERVDRLRKELDEVQKAIDKDPFNSALREEHAHYLITFKEATLDEERFLKQKSKIHWLHAGDSNTSYFHNIVKSKCARNRIELVRDSANVLHEGNAVAGAFVSHYEQFLGIEGDCSPLEDHDLFANVLNNDMADFMVRDVTNSEIKDALFSMGADLVAFKFKKLTLRARLLLDSWKIPSACIIHEGSASSNNTKLQIPAMIPIKTDTYNQNNPNEGPCNEPKGLLLFASSFLFEILTIGFSACKFLFWVPDHHS
ncbi:RNA-directed DNA polymerase, eukaryota, Reverse transcriptase zinc-binding domain protein [Artemisia annua]|uniref:RNA-directed DNA polymerase, eukaryota, Reverse transcriptase zinc-binding domain protein n=1 Tax=Artemisia annua TaxID=35608 RepID=A0A2U1MCK9_ARTAN|nr:RNA-directed DNA polymerase, eukaryota, Reverse transcriptase zinc-binding domain protein [Artemisia annua]